MNRTTNKPRPVDSRWTEDQWAAIHVQGSDLLVAAAAGSGKTAVLVERIIQLISDVEHPVHVDELLVATFTNAAASEMRERIRMALEQKLLLDPQQEHLKLQLTLLQRAQITTLHSFCLEVMHQYAHLLDIDPGFRIATDIEAQMIRSEVMEELFELRYGLADQGGPFWELSERYSNDRSDAELQHIVFQLFEQSRSHPWPEKWLKGMVEQFEVADRAEEQQGLGKWLDSLRSSIRFELQGSAELLKLALRAAQEPEGPTPYLEQLQEELIAVQATVDTCDADWDAIYQSIHAVQFNRLKSCRGDQYDKVLQEQAKQYRSQAKEQLEQQREQLFSRGLQQYAEELLGLQPMMLELVELVLQFSHSFEQAKKERGLVDFSDLEHYCLQILRDEDSTPEHLIPTPAALQFRQQFIEILLDEYQDTNQVQETIVALISRETPGNRFMVGDVKQSIYRFRLAEPELFMDKYERYFSYDDDSLDASFSEPRKIDLSRNFRSRQEVVDGVNFIFRQLMEGEVGEIQYDNKAELVRGASYPEQHNREIQPYSVEFTLLEKEGALPSFEEESTELESSVSELGDQTSSSPSAVALELSELNTVQLEARYIATQIHQMLGTGSQGFEELPGIQGSHQAEPLQIFDAKLGKLRTVTYSDIVILLRATRQWAPTLIEELQKQGIPAYAELSTGYFEAMEIEVMLALLNLIDNPFQDIPLAAVLRSPIVGLSAEELAQIRIYAPGISFFEALLAYTSSEAKGEEGAEEEEEDEEDESEANELKKNLTTFLQHLDNWRLEARQVSLPELIWRLFRETGYFDFVGGLPGGQQRQANLRALYDRAQQFESSSFRGLFRYLRFIERLRDSGGDLGTARALGEQENVVRIMTIHKSKGLEFPVVFVAGTGKKFNRQDMNGNLLIHKELGLGPRMIDPDQRQSYPTLPMLAIRNRMQLEMLAEEMRVLYVAMTRAREKLYIVGTVPRAEAQLREWSRMLQHETWGLPSYELARAGCYLDWLGPAILRHPMASALHERAGIHYRTPACMLTEHSVWQVNIAPSELLLQQAAVSREEPGDRLLLLGALQRLEAPPIPSSPDAARVIQRLSWKYPREGLSTLFAKTSVTEMKRMKASLHSLEPLPMQEIQLDELGLPQLEGDREGTGNLTTSTVDQLTLLRRPRFMEEQGLTAAERGTVFHAVMQHIPLVAPITEGTIHSVILSMLDKELLTREQARVVEPNLLLSFFQHSVGQRLIRAERKYRELPFSYALSADEVYRSSSEHRPQENIFPNEKIMIQGVIDCLFIEEDELVLLDYKTDATRGQTVGQLGQRYALQMQVYTRAIEAIWKKPLKQKYLYFFDGEVMIEMTDFEAATELPHK